MTAIAGRTWAAWPRRQRVVVIGLAGVGLGALLELAAGARTFNGVAGSWPVLLGGAAAIGVGLVAIARRTAATGVAYSSALSVVLAASSGLAVLALLDVIDVVRTTDLAPLGGLIGVAGRGLALVGAVILWLGLLAVRRSLDGPGWLAGILRGGPELALIRLGALAVVAGWLVMTVLADGFALRTLDALALVAAVTAALGLDGRLIGGPRYRTLNGLVLAGVVVAVAIVAAVDGATQVVGSLDAFLAGPAAGIAGYGAYAAGNVLLGLGALIVLRRAARTSMKPATQADELGPGAA